MGLWKNTDKLSKWLKTPSTLKASDTPCKGPVGQSSRLGNTTRLPNISRRLLRLPNEAAMLGTRPCSWATRENVSVLGAKQPGYRALAQRDRAGRGRGRFEAGHGRSIRLRPVAPWSRAVPIRPRKLSFRAWRRQGKPRTPNLKETL